jgi:hypothetical protein
VVLSRVFSVVFSYFLRESPFLFPVRDSAG